MPVTRSIALSLAALSLGLATSHATAQTMIQTTVPLQSNSDSFFESSNIGWSVRGPRFFASFNSPAASPFGGFNPNAGLSSGFAFRGGKFNGNLNFNFSQGFQRTSTTVAPTVMSLNGYPSNFFAGTVRPFVLGYVPTVGGGGRFFPGGGGQFYPGGGGQYFPGGGFYSVPSGSIPRGFGPAFQLSQLQERLKRSRQAEPTSRTDNADPGPAPRRELDTAQRASAAYGFFQKGSSNSRSGSSSQSSAARTNRTAPSESVSQTQRGSVSSPPSGSEPQSLAELYYRKGQEAETRSRTTARMYYRMAFQRATGGLRVEIDRRLRAIGR